jgi:hypothetical protein
MRRSPNGIAPPPDGRSAMASGPGLGHAHQAAGRPSFRHASKERFEAGPHLPKASNSHRQCINVLK